MDKLIEKVKQQSADKTQQKYGKSKETADKNVNKCEFCCF